MDRILLFERESGKFIRQVGKIGKGPDEYFNALDNFYNQFNNTIYTYGYLRSAIKTYTLEGKLIESFTTPIYNEISIIRNLPVDVILDSITFAGYLENNPGHSNKRIVLFSKDKEINSFPHYSILSSNNVMLFQNPIFFTWENKVSFKEKSNDTIFYIFSDKLTPRIILNSGYSRYPYFLSKEEILEQETNPHDYFYLLNLFENSEYLFFYLVNQNIPVKNRPGTFSLIYNLCIFNKITNKTIVTKNNQDINFGLIDDINNFMPVTPVTITDNNEMIAFLEPLRIIQWKTDNPKKLEDLNRKLPWLPGLTEYDNPVIIIARCKVPDD